MNLRYKAKKHKAKHNRDGMVASSRCDRGQPCPLTMVPRCQLHISLHSRVARGGIFAELSSPNKRNPPERNTTPLRALPSSSEPLGSERAFRLAGSSQSDARRSLNSGGTKRGVSKHETHPDIDRLHTRPFIKLLQSCLLRPSPLTPSTM